MTYIGSPADQYRLVAPPLCEGYDRLIEKSLGLGGGDEGAVKGETESRFIRNFVYYTFFYGRLCSGLPFIY